MKNLIPFLALVSTLLPLQPTHAADYYLSQAGAGNKDGSSWENAFDQSALSTAFNETMKPGDRLLVAGGEYPNAKLTLETSGQAGAFKTIEGVDRGSGLPVFKSPWSVDAPNKGAVGIRLGYGLSYVSIKGLRLDGYMLGIEAKEAKTKEPRSHLTFDDVDMQHFRYGYYLSDCDDLTLLHCDLKRYSKHAFRFEQGCDRVTVRACTADCSEGDSVWETKTELFPYGFSVNDGGAPNTAFTFEDCLATNNVMPLQKKKYKNGDGFVVEGNSSDVTFRRCRSIRNQDGGYDLKVKDVRLNDCLAIGNYRGYRIWKNGSLENCFSGFGNTGLWNNGGPLAVSRSTFAELTGPAVITDDNSTAPVTLTHCLIANVKQAFRNRASGQVILDGTVVVNPEEAGESPDFVKPDPAWNGLGDAMNSQRFPDKGYRAAVPSP